MRPNTVRKSDPHRGDWGVRAQARARASRPTAPVADGTWLAAMFTWMQGAGRTCSSAGIVTNSRRHAAVLQRAKEPLADALAQFRPAPNYSGGASPRVGIGLILRILRFLTVAAAVALAGPAGAQETAGVDGAERATVRVAVIVEDPTGRKLSGTGSGFLVAPNLVVTNAHVVSDAREQPNFAVAVVPPEGDGLLPARIVHYSQIADLALLEFRGGPTTAPITISTLDPRPGDSIIALGYPDVDYQHTSADDLVRPALASRTSGSIASLRDRAPTGDPIPTINHQAVISSGSSGGPLLDECGRVIGVNTWHARGADTLESRGVATRAAQLLDFLQDAGVNPRVTNERCLTFAERVERDRARTVTALEQQNRDLTAKLETADRLTRIAVVILIGGTLALFVAVGVLGAILLSRKHPQQQATYEIAQPKRTGLGVAAVVGGAAIAALIVVAAGVALLRARDASDANAAALARFSGDISCSLDRTASRDPGNAEQMRFTASGALCVDDSMLYAPARDGRRYQRAVLARNDRALEVSSIDPATGEFRRERYALSQSAFGAAAQAAGATSSEGCDSQEARDAAARRNETLLRFAEGRPVQRIVWRCSASPR